jgi:glycosyltransferase involved in cell wall biosynthesis
MNILPTRVLVDALSAHGTTKVTGPGRAAIADALSDRATIQDAWLAFAVLTRTLPTEHETRLAHRSIRTQGAQKFVDRAVAAGEHRRLAGRTVELLRDAVIVDVRHTAETDLATGIQRVARETVRRWDAEHELVLVTWTDDAKAMRRVSSAERSTALDATPPLHKSTKDLDRRVVVPAGGWYLLPELAAEAWRTERLVALAQFSGAESSVIGFDCVPLTTAETVGDGMPAAFARNLAAVARMNRVGAISVAAATEYLGWRDMLAGVGIPGPDIRAIMLAAEPREAAPADLEEFTAVAELDDLPLVLVVGSHEPRKNHMAILHAAELLWQRGERFRLVFIGGNSWNSLDFSDLVETLRRAGRPLIALSSLPDRLLWAAYRLARFSVFPSINEGFGLPIAESISCGTPVVTSAYGSMREVGEGNGALLVDSRDDDALAAGIRRLLEDDTTYQALRAEASGYVPRTWNAYADDLWAYFVTETE